MSLLRIITKLFTAIYSKVSSSENVSHRGAHLQGLTYTLLSRRVRIILVPSLLQLLFYNSSSNIDESNDDDDNDKTSILEHAENYSWVVMYK